jgi:hypothetical protein
MAAFRSSGQEPQNDSDSETEILSPPSRSTITSRHAGSKCLSRSWLDSRTPYPAPVRRGLPLLHARTSIESGCVVTIKIMQAPPRPVETALCPSAKWTLITIRSRLTGCRRHDRVVRARA